MKPFLFKAVLTPGLVLLNQIKDRKTTINQKCDVVQGLQFKYVQLYVS